MPTTYEQLERDYNRTRARCREAAQVLIERIGAEGPMGVEEAARLAAAELDALRARVAELEQSVHDLCFERGALTMQRDRLRAALEAAPEPARLRGSPQAPADGDYDWWHRTTRREALDG